MSTNADCHFFEKKPGKWFYSIAYPVEGTGESDEDGDMEFEPSTTSGPFPTYRAAESHLNSHHANPGGWSTTPLPGCKHDLVSARDGERGCDRCGEFLPAPAVVKVRPKK